MLTILFPVAMLMQAQPVAQEPRPRPAIASALATVRIIRAEPVQVPRAGGNDAPPPGAVLTRSAERVIVEFY